MIEQGIKNYFKSFQYFFTPLGTLALGFILGLSVAIPLITGALQTLTSDLTAVFEHTQIDYEQLKSSLYATFGALDWRHPLAAIKTILDADWLNQTFHDCISALTSDYEPLTTGVSNAVNACVGSIFTAIRIVVFFLIFGSVLGYFLTRFLIRRKIAKRSFWRFFWGTLLSAVVSSALLGLCAYLAALWQPSAYLSFILSVLIYGIVTLVNAYLMHGRKCVSVKEVVNLANILKLLLTNLIIFAFSAAFSLICIYAVNKLVGIFLGLVFFEIGFLVIDLNAEAYVKSLCEQRESAAQPKPEPPAE